MSASRKIADNRCSVMSATEHSTAHIVPYEIPEADADLWTCGDVLSRRRERPCQGCGATHIPKAPNRHFCAACRTCVECGATLYASEAGRKHRCGACLTGSVLYEDVILEVDGIPVSSADEARSVAREKFYSNENGWLSFEMTIRRHRDGKVCRARFIQKADARDIAVGQLEP
jgi:hypothetical protein